MGCINISVSANKDINITSKASKPINVMVTPFICSCNVECNCETGLDVNVDMLSIAKVNIMPKINGLNIKCGVVCSLTDVMFINIFPQEVQWITTDDVVIYSVESNTDWIIE